MNLRLCPHANCALRRAAPNFAMVRWAEPSYQGQPEKGVESEGGLSREDIMRRLELLRIEHRDLDGAIGALVGSGAGDQMQVARLKKRKLRLRDEIALLEDSLIPDIIA